MSGLGTEIERIIPGIFKREGCSCGQMADQLNHLGLVGARMSRDFVIAKLVTEAKARWYLKWLGVRLLTRLAAFVFDRALSRADLSDPASQVPVREPSLIAACKPKDSTRYEGGIAVVSVAVGPKARQIREFTWPRMEAYAKAVGAAFVGLEDDACPAYPIGNKWRLANVGLRYDRCLFLDHDVWLTHETPNLFRLSPGRIWAHFDHSALHSYDWLDNDCRLLDETQGIQVPFVLTVTNTGVVLFDREHSTAWLRPRKPFLPTHTFEQTLFEVRARHYGFKFRRLPAWLNLQYWMTRGADWDRKPACVYHMANMPHGERVRWLQARQSLNEPLPVPQAPSLPSQAESLQLHPN